MPKMKATVKGLVEAQAHIQAAIVDLHGQPMVDAMTKATLLVERDAKIGAPVDRGQLGQSITHEIRQTGLSGENTIQGVVGSNRENAKYMELGTGLPAGHARVKFPPPSAFEVWARRHGFKSGYVVARAIWLRGGLVPRKFLEKALDKNRQAIIDLIEKAVNSISKKANS